MTVRSNIGLKKISYLLLLLISFIILPVSHVCAAEDDIPHEVVYTNSETGYRALILDKASIILSESDDEYYSDMTEKMKEITEYGNVALITIDKNSYSARRFAEGALQAVFKNEKSSTVFLIDMDNREIYIYSYGKILKTITQPRAFVITDNIYRYATRGNFIECAYRAFEQECTLLEGRRIAQPMRYISSVLIALMCAGIVIYSRARKNLAVAPVKLDELIKYTDYELGIKDFDVYHISKTKVENTSSALSYSSSDSSYSSSRSSSRSSYRSSSHSSSSRSSSSHSSSSSRSSGGRSGGGGGHKF